MPAYARQGVDLLFEFLKFEVTGLRLTFRWWWVARSRDAARRSACATSATRKFNSRRMALPVRETHAAGAAVDSDASFVLVFDDTGGLTTGVALSNVAAPAATVTAKIYDEAGVLLQTASINLAGRGHTSFLLPDGYSVTANKMGMVEFVVPAGGKINAVGLRAKGDGTLTTIPVLVK